MSYYDEAPQESIEVRARDSRIDLVHKFIDATAALEDARRRREQAGDEVEKLSQVLYNMRQDLASAFGIGQEAMTNDAPKRAY